MATFAAVDLGASNGRVMRAEVRDGAVRLEPVHRFPNHPVERDGHLRWDFDVLLEHVRTGLLKCGKVTSVGIDTWGVDYGLLDTEGRLLAPPISYRDTRTTNAIELVHAVAAPTDLFAINGLQHLPFNTIYQLAAERQGPLWDRVARVVLMADLVAFCLTGRLGTEATNASTTGLLDARTHDWSGTLLNTIDLDAALLPPIRPPGAPRGCTTSDTPVVTVASHDTASAVVGVPATTPDFAYIVSGTWSLVGLELDEPVLSDEARLAGFTNELGIDGTTRFLRNVSGLWLLQESLRTWGRTDLIQLLAAAAALPPGGPRIDVDDPAYLPPGDMPARITSALSHQLTPVGTVRCILDSLAAAYARTIHEAERVTGRRVSVVHVVGGGCQNALLCQLASDALELPVVAGPAEATALGNVLVQARAHGLVGPSLVAMRQQIAASLQLSRYEPR